MSPLREFCPSCGAAAAQGLRRRDPGSPEGRSPEELKRNRKTVLIVCAAIVGVFAVGGRMHFPFPPVHINLDHHDHGSKGPVTINAVDLARAYAADPGAAETRFAGREIMVSGEFLRIVPDGYGSIDLRLKAASPDFPLGVDVSNQSVDDAKQLRPGQQVTVSCRDIAGSGNNRWLRDCAIQTEAGSDGRPTPPAPQAPPPPPPPPPPTTK